MPIDRSYDVVVVGSGIAGPTAAILLGRAGARVALLEAHSDPGHYKRLCTHFIQASARPVLERLGVVEELEAAGAVRNSIDVWTRYGWIREGEHPGSLPAYGYNVRREVVDPMLRRTAAATAGVQVIQGAKVTGLLRKDGRVCGVRARVAGEDVDLGAALVVGADGRHSTVADEAEMQAIARPNNRFAYFAHYRGVERGPTAAALMWQAPPDSAYVFHNDDGISLLAAMPGKERLADFEQDRESALSEFVGSRPDAPDLSAAERVSPVVGTKDYPLLVRRRVAAPGVGLVGDAAMVGDPLWGIGCGFAFQTGAWLADAVTPGVLGSDRKRVDKGLSSYQRKHRIRLLPHQALMVDFASGRDWNPLERVLFGGATVDDRVAQTVWEFGSRNRSPAALMAPATILRAGRAFRRIGRVAG